MKQRIFLIPLVFCVALVSGAAYATLYNMWDLEAVDEEGLGTHPLVGADFQNSENRVTVEGIALNTTGELLDPMDVQHFPSGPDRRSPGLGGEMVVRRPVGSGGVCSCGGGR